MRLGRTLAMLAFALALNEGSRLASAGAVSHYRAWLGVAAGPNGKPNIVLRRFERDGAPFALTVVPGNLETRLLLAADLALEPATWDALARRFEGSAYLRALHDAGQRASALQDAGITHVLPEGRGVPGIVLTVDLCPSHHPLDRALFDRLVAAFAPKEHPVPIGIALSGTWMKEHPADVAWLASEERAGRLAITWINHAFHHRYERNVPLPQNFLRRKGTRLDDEVLDTEKAMLDAGLVPSVMFRFPGLVSDETMVREVIGFGLIPIGSDAWLAKKQQAHAGGIVLVHGNGNERVGVKDLLDLIGQGRMAKEDVAARQFLLLDLRQSLSEAEK